MEQTLTALVNVEQLIKEAGGDRTNLRTRRAVEAGLQSAGIQSGADRPRYMGNLPLQGVHAAVRRGLAGYYPWGGHDTGHPVLRECPA